MAQSRIVMLSVVLALVVVVAIAWFFTHVPSSFH